MDVNPPAPPLPQREDLAVPQYKMGVITVTIVPTERTVMRIK